QSPALVLSRESSYIGTLIDDLVTKEIQEPYRMLTSRSEYRLLLRQDNADVRLTPLGRDLGLVDDTRWQVFQEKQKRAEAELNRLQTEKIPVDEALNAKLLAQCGETVKEKCTLLEFLRRPQVTYETLKIVSPLTHDVLPDVAEFVETEIKYEGYLVKQKQSVKKLSEAYKVNIPMTLDYTQIKQLSNEAREKLSKIKPTDLGQAQRIPGITPADISILQVLLSGPKKVHPSP
ncbi:MAG: tRNA uridine-5-carboxymethylaminomethyl(34) synthesis enzyme MnmG, partial [Cyanobacteria bacterium]|nr:tRNA uridine-5-carboxymethylaminomethyl(34) synthesis enzyme MnmG [Cyanobacteriota bacterium]